MKWLSVAAFFVAAMAASAQSASAQSAPARTFADPALQLTFSYPSQLTPIRAAAGPGCPRALLKATLGTDPNENASDNGSAAAPVSGPWATLSISDMGPDCIPAQALKKPKVMDRMLTSLAGGPTEVLGLMPMEQTLGYQLQGRHAFLATAQGQPVSPIGLQPANGAEVLAIIATRVKNHIVVWRIASNDVGLLNQLLAGPVDFGQGPQALYPGHVGE